MPTRGLTGEEIDARRALVAPWLEWATRGGAVSEDDPRYQIVTEHRDVGAMQARYSSCGDLAHWLLYRLGVRLPWINRQEFHGWSVGANVSKLASNPCVQVPTLETKFGAGDVVVIWNHPQGDDAHVIVCAGEMASDGLITTAEYGQPGGRLGPRVFKAANGARTCGPRRLQRWLPLAFVLEIAEEQGMLVDAEIPHE
jgi:hypothetical protein